MEKEGRVGIFSPYPLIPNTPDGVKSYILGLQKTLTQKGIDAFLVGPSLPKRSSNMADETLGYSLFPVKIGKSAYKGTFTCNEPRAANILKNRSPDVLDFQDPLASPFTFLTVLVARRLVLKDSAVVVQFHAYTEHPTFVQNSLIFAGKTSGLTKRAMKEVHEKSATSPDTAGLWAGVNNEDVSAYEIIPNGIDVDRFVREKDGFRNWNFLREQGYKIVLVTARHNRRKGLDVLIRSIGKLIKQGERRDLLLKLTGTDQKGQISPQLQELVKSLGISEFVEFLGNLSDEDLIKADKSCDLLVAPSIGEEGTNRTILEGRAAEKLVVATRIGGQTFAYGNPNVFGDMVKPNDVDSLAIAINDFINLPQEEVNRRTSEGLIFVSENFSWDKVGDKKIRQYERAIQKSHALSKSGVIYKK